MFELMGMEWIIILVVLVIIEIVTMGLTTIWFAGGALAAFLVYLLGANLFIQIAVFFVVSMVLLIFTRPFAAKYINRDRTKTNAEGLIGTIGLVADEIDNMNAVGKVIVQGLEWTARAADNEKIQKGKEVIIEEIQGVKLIVREKEE